MEKFYPPKNHTASLLQKIYLYFNKLLILFFLFFSINIFSQSNHTVAFTGSASDFNALEKISASAGNTDYYITFDQNNLYIGAFRTSGSFATNDNLAIYIDTDPQTIATTGNGSRTGKSYNGVNATLPFRADYNVYAEETIQQANIYSLGWTITTGPIYLTSTASREVKIPFAGMGNPYALNITMWIGNAGSIYSNAPGTNITSSATPVIANYFGTFGIRNGAQGNVNPVNIILSPATGYLSASGTIAGGTYAYLDVTGATTINGLTLAPGGVINVNAGKNLTSSGTINNTTTLNNTKSTQINVSGNYTLTGRAYFSSFNVDNGATYTHNVAGSSANGDPSDWPGIDTRTYGATSNVNINQWATNSATVVAGIPVPTSGGWGNVTFNISQKFKCNWMMNGAFNNVEGNLILNNIGIPSTYNYLTFNNDFGTTGKMNIGGNFEMRTPPGNDIYFNFALFTKAIFTLNVKGDFIVTGGHIKFGHKLGKVIVNYWGNLNQTGGEVRSETTDGVTINAYGINKFISGSYKLGSGTDFNTTDITFDIKSGASIYLNSAIPLSGSNFGDPTNCIFIVDGTLNCNGNQITNSGGGATFTLSPGGTLEITDKNGISAAGINSGSIQTQYRNFSTQANYVYNGTTAQVTGSGLPSTVNSLTINNSTHSNIVSLTNDVTITSFNEIDKGIFSLGSKNVILHSDASTTASFNAMGAGATISYGAGRYIVERFINTGTGAGQHGKSWQLLSAPADGGTVYNTWQESGSTTTGYGTWVTDPSGKANGFDDYSPAPSIKTYNPVTNDWDGISSSNNFIANQIGYFLFVRGDRNARTVNATPTPTTLQIKGKLFTGNLPVVNVPAGLFKSIGNPYASAVNFQTLYSHSTNIDNTFYVWDPSLSGSYGLGGYQTISGAIGYLAVPGGSHIYNTTTIYRNIQSGEAFFVYNSASSPGSVNFSEDCKNIGSILVNRETGSLTNTQFLFADMFTSFGILADGNAVAFDNSFSNKIDKDDAIKLINTGENFGIKKDSVNLAIEARLPVVQTDTVFYYMNNLKQQDYRLLFIPKNFSPDSDAFLIDQDLKTETPVSLSDSTYINFSVTSDPASSEANRFMLVFRPAEVLSVNYISVNAYKQNTNIHVEWEVENEKNMMNYEAERSIDGTHFSKIATIAAMNISKNIYDYIDKNPFAGINYYRILSLQQDGQAGYSKIVKADMGKVKSSINVYPNPLSDEAINLQFTNQPAGKYQIRLLNSSGQMILSKVFDHAGGNHSLKLIFNGKVAHGIYQLEITRPDGEKNMITVRK